MPGNDVTPLFKDHKRTAERLRAGDRTVTEAVVNAYMEHVFRAARGAGLDEATAEDVTQATFVTFLDKAGTFDGRSHVRTWLFGILYNKILEAHRETKRDQDHDPIDELVEQRFAVDGSWQRPPQPVDMGVYNEEIRRQIEGCLEAAPMQAQLALVLRDIEGFSMEEICNVLRFTRTNLGVVLHRARNRIRECLEAVGVKGSSDAEM